jgi:hypothetical protein
LIINPQQSHPPNDWKKFPYGQNVAWGHQTVVDSIQDWIDEYKVKPIKNKDYNCHLALLWLPSLLLLFFNQPITVNFIGWVFEYRERLGSQSNTNFIAHWENLIFNITYLISLLPASP